VSYEVIDEVINFRAVVDYLNSNEDAFTILSTGGWHGTNKTLDDCEKIINDEDPNWLPGGASVTVLIIDPAKVCVRWGEIKLKDLNQVAWLRKKVQESVDRISISQEGNK
jgi:hypothetical protein